MILFINIKFYLKYFYKYFTFLYPQMSEATKLSWPLPKHLTDFIKAEQPKLGSILISAIEFTIKESNNHFADVLSSVEPLLKENAHAFVTKLFSKANETEKCTDNDDRPKRVTFDLDSGKRVQLTPAGTQNIRTPMQMAPSKNENPEVVFNRVDETRFNIEDIRAWAARFGSVNSLRRLNRGKYLVIFETPEDAQKVIENTEEVLGDINIKKFYNVINNMGNNFNNYNNYNNLNNNFNGMQNNLNGNFNSFDIKRADYKNSFNKRIDIHALLQEQREVLNKMSVFYDPELFASLKAVTQKIRNYILQSNLSHDPGLSTENRYVKRPPYEYKGNNPQGNNNFYANNNTTNNNKSNTDNNANNSDSGIESSLYYNMFAE